MGREAVCEATYRGESSPGRAHLDTDALTFRGDFRLNISYRDVESAEARDGTLHLRFRGENVELRLGAESGPWAERILNPPSLMKKLGVKPGMSAGVIGPVEPTFIGDLANEGVVTSQNSGLLDILFLQTDEPGELDNLSEARARIRQDGAVWVITPRGRKDLRDYEVMAAGKEAGLVDVKVCRFSDTHTALKFVIPKADRKPG